MERPSRPIVRVRHSARLSKMTNGLLASGKSQPLAFQAAGSQDSLLWVKKTTPGVDRLGRGQEWRAEYAVLSTVDWCAPAPLETGPSRFDFVLSCTPPTSSAAAPPQPVNVLIPPQTGRGALSLLIHLKNNHVPPPG